MFQMVTTIIRWSSIPVLLITSLFSRLAGNYELPLEIAIWCGAIFLAQRAVRSGEYAWAAGLGLVVIIFSPMMLVDKIFLFMAYSTTMTFLTLAAAFRPRPLVAEL